MSCVLLLSPFILSVLNIKHRLERPWRTRDRGLLGKVTGFGFRVGKRSKVINKKYK